MRAESAKPAPPLDHSMILRPKFIPSFLPEILSFRNNVAVGAGSNDLLSNDSLAALDRFVRDCYNTGVWNKLLEVYPFVGSNILAALIKLKFTSSVLLTGVNMVAVDYEERGANG